MVDHQPHASVHQLQQEFQLCRGTGHQWDIFNDFFRTRPVVGFLLSLRCVRCGTVRNDVLDGWGTTHQRSYRYPEGYLFSSELEDLPTRTDFKLLLASRYGVNDTDTDTKRKQK